MTQSWLPDTFIERAYQTARAHEVFFNNTLVTLTALESSAIRTHVSRQPVLRGLNAAEVLARLKMALARAENVVSVGKSSPTGLEDSLGEAYAEAYGYLHETVRAIVHGE